MRITPHKAKRRPTLRTRLGTLGRRTLDFLLPRRCALCGEVLLLFTDGELCPGCLGAYSARVLRPCLLCQKSAGDCRCPSRRTRNLIPPPATLGFYDNAKDEVGRLVYSFKRRYSRELTRFFARSLAVQIRRRGFADGAIVTYPPRSHKALTMYGFDQSQALARETARYLGLEACTALRRLGGDEQKELGANERAENVSGVFAHNPKAELAGRNVILVDDIATTGATLAEAARVLRSAGAAQVHFAVLFLTAARRTSPGHVLWFEEDDVAADTGVRGEENTAGEEYTLTGDAAIGEEEYDIAAEDVGF